MNTENNHLDNEYEGLDPFDIEVQFGIFIKRIYGSRVRTMPVYQLKQLQQCFFAAWGQLLILQREQMPTDENQAVSKFQSMWNQLVKYWNKETRGQN